MQPEFQTLGDFVLKEALGTGAMGTVYRAHQVSLDREVAIKILRNAPQLDGDHSVDGGLDQRFFLEGKTLARLEHSNIVQVYETNLQENVPYIAMEFVDGPTLSEFVQDKLEPKQIAEIILGVACGLKHAHEKEIIHRDLKPSNILISTTTNQPKIVDFGLAKNFANPSDFTQSQQILGTPNYMSPEQLSDPSSVGFGSDIYSIGAVLYELLVGKPPFRHRTGELLPTVAKERSHHDRPLAPRRINHDVPIDLESICLKCLETRPKDRYLSAGDLADDVNRFLKGEPTVARPVPLRRKLWWKCKSHPVWSTVLLLVITFITIGYLVQQDRIRTETALREQAESELGTTIEALERFYVRFSENPLLQSKGLEEFRKSVLSDALDFYDQLEGRNPESTELQARFANAFILVGKITQELGPPEDAIVAFEKAEKRLAKLVEKFPNNVDFKHHLYRAQQNKGVSLSTSGKPKEAIEILESVYQDRRKLLSQTSSDELVRFQSMVINALGKTEQSLNQTEKATAHFKEAIDILSKHVDDRKDVSPDLIYSLALSHNNFAASQFSSQNYDLVDAHQKRISQLLTPLASAGQHPKYAFLLGASRNMQASIARMSGRTNQAINLYIEACEINESIANEHSLVDVYQRALAIRYLNLGLAYFDNNQNEQGISALETARQKFAELVRVHPTISANHFSLARVSTSLCRHFNRIDETDRATLAAREALGAWQSLFNELPNLRKTHCSDFVQSCLTMGVSFPQKQGLAKEVIKIATTSIEHIEKFATPSFDHALLIDSLLLRAGAFSQSRRYNDAINDLQVASSMSEGTLKKQIDAMLSETKAKAKIIEQPEK